MFKLAYIKARGTTSHLAVNSSINSSTKLMSVGESRPLPLTAAVAAVATNRPLKDTLMTAIPDLAQHHSLVIKPQLHRQSMGTTNSMRRGSGSCPIGTGLAQCIRL